MVSLVPTISSTISRLPFLPKPSFYFSFRALRTSKLPHRELTPTPSPLSSSSAVHSMSNSNSPKPITENPSNLSDNLVILGIETSCDDTAAAVVSHTYKNTRLFIGTVVSFLGICFFYRFGFIFRFEVMGKFSAKLCRLRYNV